MPIKFFADAAVPAGISKPPSSNDYLFDRGFRSLSVIGTTLIIALVAYILWEIGGQALPAIRDYHRLLDV